MTKLFKNNKGFTLVEVIVVAVIVLILAAVAIPLYNGYIQDSRQSTVENAAVAIASAFGAAIQTDGQIDGKAANAAGGDASGGSFVQITTEAGNTSRIMVPNKMTATWTSSLITVTDGKVTGTATFNQ